MDAKDTTEEAAARTDLAEAIKHRDDLARRLAKARKALEKQRDMGYTLTKELDEISHETPSLEADRLEKLASLLDADKPISATRRPKLRISELTDEIAASDALCRDIDALVKKLEREHVDATFWLKRKAGRVLCPTLRDFVEKAKAKRDELLALRLQLNHMRVPDEPRELSEEMNSFLNDPLSAERYARPTPESAALWAQALAALENDANAPLPKVAA